MKLFHYIKTSSNKILAEKIQLTSRRFIKLHITNGEN